MPGCQSELKPDSRSADSSAEPAEQYSNNSTMPGFNNNGTQTAATDSQPDLPMPPGMVWIPAGKFLMGCDTRLAREDEKPTHVVRLTGFYIDVTEITNAQFSEFVAATGYITTAEKKPELAEIMKQQPPGSPPPDESVLVPGSLVFQMTDQPVNTSAPDAFIQWWRWTPGASWRHPQGPDSNIDELSDHPVVQVSWDDAVAYCSWAGKSLPTEAQWEYAARGGLHQQPFVWGDEPDSDKTPQANIWQGQFPNRNALIDGFAATAPVKSFPANGYGLYDVAGNVWEWCGDWYRADYYQSVASIESIDPTGPPSTDHPYEPRRVNRGGSFLCHRDYCSSYRPSARMSTSHDSGLCHIGFRGAMSESQWRERLRQQDSLPPKPEIQLNK